MGSVVHVIGRARDKRAQEERAAGEELRRDDLRRYREVLDAAEEALAFTDPDLFVGRRLASPQERRRLFGASWPPATTEQQKTVHKLTEDLGAGTLVRQKGAGSLELVGVKDFVAFRYIVDPEGNATRVSKDESRAVADKRIAWSAVLGLGIFVGSVIVLPVFRWIVHPSPGYGWLGLVPLVGLFLFFLALAMRPGNPRRFVKTGEWHQFDRPRPRD